MPAIESGDATFGCGGHSPAYQFALDFPGSDDDPAPQLVAQIEDLIKRYLKEPKEPDWPGKWAQMYDRQGDKRYAINLLHVGSAQLSSEEHAKFAYGFDRVADRVFQQTGVLVGFTLDLLPREEDAIHVNKGGCSQDDFKEITFTAKQEDTGPWLREQGSFLAVQAFIPEIYTGSSDKLGFKGEYLQRWIKQRLPVFFDADPGYDGHIVFNNDTMWGNDDGWRAHLLELRRDLPVKGVVFNTWNGYTEGYAAVPTLENGDADFRWMQELFS